jgi:hypothetical protein
MGESSEEGLLSVIQASDMVLSQEGDSEDPVASRRVAEALARKASALRKSSDSSASRSARAGCTATMRIDWQVRAD